MRRTSLASTLVVAVMVPGCAGGQSGDLSGRDDSPGAAGRCEDHVVLLDRNETSTLGFSAEQVLGFAARSFTAPLSWHPTQGMTYVPGPGESTVTVNVTSLGRAELVHSVNSAVPPGSDPAPQSIVQCSPDRMRIDVRVRVATADGALAEVFDTTMVSTDGRIASWVVGLQPTSVGGSFTYGPADPAGSWGLAPFGYAVFRGSLTGAGMAGDLFADVWSDLEKRSVERLTFARFPDDPRCPAGDFWPPSRLPITIDSNVLGASGSAVVSEINAWGPLALRWGDGASSELTLALSEIRTGCLGTYYAEAQQVTYPVTLRATTADGQLDGSYPAYLSVDVRPPGAPARRRISLNMPFEVGAMERAGFPGAGVPSDASALGVKIEATFDEGRASGVVELNASRPPCAPQRPQTTVDQCKGVIVTPLLAGGWDGAR